MFRRILPVAVFVALAALLIAGLINAPTKEIIPSPLVGKPMPAFALPVLGHDGQALSSEDLLGQPFILNVWASWCPSCRIEHPQITDIARTGGIAVYGLNYKDDPQDAQRWLEQFGNPYTASLQDEDGRVGIDFGVYKAPETFFIDAKGTVRYKFTGPITEYDWRTEVQPIVKQMISKASS